MFKRSLLSVLLVAGVGLPAQALPSCYIELDNGDMYDMGHMCVSPAGSRVIDQARMFRQAAQDLRAPVEADRARVAGNAANARFQQTQGYYVNFWENSEDFWEGEVTEADLELRQFDEIEGDIADLESLGFTFRVNSGFTGLEDMEKDELSLWEWAIGTSGLY